MKVELLVNLKLGNGQIISAGSVYSDKNTPIPEFVMRRLKRGMARIIENDPVPPPPIFSKSQPVKDTVSEVETSSKKAIKKKIRKEEGSMTF